MVDQAEKLRELMAKMEKQKLEPVNKKSPKAKVISVTSGKGGVGKTNFSINFAISLKNLGYEVLVFDADIGLANAEIISGTIIDYTIANLFNGDKQNIFDIISKGPKDIKIISGGSGLEELALINEGTMLEIIKQLEKLEYYFDFIIIDTGAGISDIVIDFLMASEEVIFVITPDPTSLTDSYALLKALITKGYLGRLNVVMNMVENQKEALNIYKKLNQVTKKFLKTNIEFIGYLNRSNVVVNAVRKQKPFIMSHPKSSLSREIKAIALDYAKRSGYKETENNLSFTGKLRELFTKRWSI